MWVTNALTAVQTVRDLVTLGNYVVTAVQHVLADSKKVQDELLAKHRLVRLAAYHSNS
jgi:hypothetical protein